MNRKPDSLLLLLLWTDEQISYGRLMWFFSRGRRSHGLGGMEDRLLYGAGLAFGGGLVGDGFFMKDWSGMGVWRC